MPIVLVTKLAIVAGAVYMTREMGIWDSPERAVEIFNDIKSELVPCIENFKQKYCSRYCVIGSGEVKTLRETWIDAWNDSLKFIFLKLSYMPEYCEKFKNDVQNSFRDPQKDPPDTTKVGQEETNPKSE